MLIRVKAVEVSDAVPSEAFRDLYLLDYARNRSTIISNDVQFKRRKQEHSHS